nr:RNA-directed DNA polymerase, eukaryota, reverse transcriptase zinc-binding domain protein [Tanacetum cinerariifolium]
MNGVPHFGVSIGEQFVNHFQSVLGNFYKVLPINNPEFLFTNKLSEGDAAYMIRDISDDEVKVALFDIDNNKAPGPDGYSSQFFKDAWNVIAKEFCKAVREFFTSGKLLKEVNATVISLVPKISTPKRVSDFRPIACCNVVYKCISKIMVNRIKGCLCYLVDQNQSDFIPSRQINDNVLLSQELLRGYHRKRGYTSKSVSILKNSLDEFGSVSSLLPSSLKSKVMPFIEGKLPVRIGNGLDTSLWFDNWHAICPLSEFISKRKIYYSGLSLDCKVANVIDNGVWKWPRDLSMEFDGLNAIEPPCLIEGKKDKVFWKTGAGRLSDFF